MWAAPDRTPQNRIRDRRFWILISTTFFAGMAVALYRGVISNYALQELHVGATRYGLLDGIREIPGLLTAGLAAMTVSFREEYGFAAWALLLGAGAMVLYRRWYTRLRHGGTNKQASARSVKSEEAEACFCGVLDHASQACRIC